MRATASLSTHVLDTRSGRPAPGLRVTLRRVDGTTATPISERVTDADGRIRELATGLEPGTYRLTFEIAGYFAAARGIFDTVSFDVVLGEGHHHVPLLVSPFAFVCYRGS
jgi:5-hydroxyisourate hydrolase